MRALIARASSRIDAWIDTSYRVDARGLALYRILFASTKILVLFPTYAWIGGYPNAFWKPPLGPFRLLHGFPPTGVLFTLDCVLSVALVALLFGYRTPLASYAVGLTLLIGNGFLYSFGHVDHQIMTSLPPLILAHSGWGSAWSIDAHRRRGRHDQVRGWPLSLLCSTLALFMLSAGLPKVAGGWLDLHTRAVAKYMVIERAERLVPTRVFLPSGFVGKSGDWLTVALELAFIATLLWPRAFRLVVAAAALFHLTIFFALHIDFSSSLFVYAVLLPWERLARRIRSASLRVPRVLLRAIDHPVLLVAALAAAVLALRYSAGPPLQLVFGWTADPARAVGLLIHVAAAAAGLAYIAHAGAGKAKRVFA